MSIIDSGAVSQSIDVQIVDDTGLPVTGLVAATFPTVKASLAGANASSTITLSDLATETTAYASGGVFARGEGVYRLDLPNALLAAAGRLRIRGEATGKRLIADTIDIAPTVNATRLSGTAQTARDIGASVLVSPGTGTGQINLTSGAVDLVDAPNATALNAIADATLDRTAGVETNRTLRQAMRLMLAAMIGKLSGAATTTVSIRDSNDSKNRVVATVDANGNRTAVTLDQT